MKKRYIEPRIKWVLMDQKMPLMVGGSVSDKLDPLDPEETSVKEETYEWHDFASVWDEEW